MSGNKSFRIGQTVVYPAHGVGKITGFEEKEIAGFTLDVIIIACERGMTLRLPKDKADKNGLRPVSNEATILKAFETLRDSPRQQQGIWARRAKDLDEKVNSGDLVMMCRLLRDLAPRTRTERGLSYSERQYFETAITRASQEIAIARKKSPETVRADMEKALSEQKPPIIVTAH